jgi:hypothetical protein
LYFGRRLCDELYQYINGYEDFYNIESTDVSIVCGGGKGKAGDGH